MTDIGWELPLCCCVATELGSFELFDCLVLCAVLALIMKDKSLFMSSASGVPHLCHLVSAATFVFPLKFQITISGCLLFCSPVMGLPQNPQLDSHLSLIPVFAHTKHE